MVSDSHSLFLMLPLGEMWAKVVGSDIHSGLQVIAITRFT